MSSARVLVLALALLVALLSFVWFVAQDSSDEIATIEAITSVAREAPEPPAIVDSGVRDLSERQIPRAMTIEVVESLAHDTGAFTQGLELSDGRLFESTGLVGRSTLRELDPATGTIVRSAPIADRFAEGLTIVDDEIIQLTWKDGVAFRYDLDTFELVETYDYEGDGWGLCRSAERLVMSDGSSDLTFRDPDSFEVQGEVAVTFSGAPVPRINELECVDGHVWANIWKTNLIIEIDPESGQVLTVIDASDLRPESTFGDTSAVLNGIAHDPTNNTFLITGKKWPIMYRVRFVASA